MLNIVRILRTKFNRPYPTFTVGKIGEPLRTTAGLIALGHPASAEKLKPTRSPPNCTRSSAVAYVGLPKVKHRPPRRLFRSFRESTYQFQPVWSTRCLRRVMLLGHTSSA